jgi:hypothetical protein
MRIQATACIRKKCCAWRAAPLTRRPMASGRAADMAIMLMATTAVMEKKSRLGSVDGMCVPGWRAKRGP